MHKHAPSTLVWTSLDLLYAEDTLGAVSLDGVGAGIMFCLGDVDKFMVHASNQFLSDAKDGDVFMFHDNVKIEPRMLQGHTKMIAVVAHDFRPREKIQVNELRKLRHEGGFRLVVGPSRDTMARVIKYASPYDEKFDNDERKASLK